jgi:hypothetical protein
VPYPAAALEAHERIADTIPVDRVTHGSPVSPSGYHWSAPGDRCPIRRSPHSLRPSAALARERGAGQGARRFSGDGPWRRQAR